MMKKKYKAFLFLMAIAVTPHTLRAIWPFARQVEDFNDFGQDIYVLRIKKIFKDAALVGDLSPGVLRIYNHLKNTNDNENAQKNKYLFYGPPGNGKTLTARILAEVVGAKFKKIATSTLVTPYQGAASESIINKVKEAVQDAEKEAKKVVILFDEVDAIAGVTENGTQRHDEAQAVKTLWDTCDGYEKNNNVIFIFATNKKENLDKAFLSRVEEQSIRFENPTRESRKELFELYADKFKISLSHALIEEFVQKTDNTSIRFIENFMIKFASFMNDHPNCVLKESDIKSILQAHVKRSLESQGIVSGWRKYTPQLSNVVIAINTTANIINAVANVLNVFNKLPDTPASTIKRTK